MNNNSNNTWTDAELFSRIAAGDGKAFAGLFDKYFEILKWRAIKLLKSTFWADEIVQDVFMQLWANRAQLQQVGNPAFYLYRITTNRCLDRIRREELEVKAQYVLNQVLLNTNDKQYSTINYDYQLLQRLIKEAVEMLPLQGKEVYRLQQEDGLSYEQIAEKLAISKNTVRNHMVKNLAHIRMYLKEKMDFLLLTFLYLEIFFKNQ